MAVAGTAEGGHHDDVQLGVLALDLAEQVQPVLVGQLDVHHHQVGALLADLGDRCGTGLRLTNFVAGVLQKVRQQRTNLGIVIDDQH